MNALEYLFSKHEKHLDPDERRSVLSRIAMLSETVSFARPADLDPLDTQRGWLMIEREFSSDPVWLFGQDAPSLAHSRVRVFRGSRDAPEEVFSARISEKSLTEAILDSSRGEGAPMTVTRLGDTEVPERGRPDVAARREEMARDLRKDPFGSLDHLEGMLAGGARKPTTALKDAVGSVVNACRNIGDVRFALDRHVETMTKFRTQVVTEAAHAALHAHKVEDAMAGRTPDPLRIAPRENVPFGRDGRDNNPMVEMMTFQPEPDLLHAVRKMILEEIRDVSVTHPGVESWIRDGEFGPEARIPDSRGISAGLGYSDASEALKKRMDTLQGLQNSLFNPHVAEAREAKRADQVGLSISRIYGWTGQINSSLPAGEGTYFQISISPAIEEISFGVSEVRTLSMPIVQLNMVSDDLMMALRGHPEGDPVPCSIRILCGVPIPQVETPKHEITIGLEQVSEDVQDLPEFRDLMLSARALSDLVTSGRSGAAWASEIEASLDGIRSGITAARDAVEDLLAAGRSDIDARMAENARSALASISSSIPAGVVDLLMNREDRDADLDEGMTPQ